MKLIEPSVELIKQESGVEGIYKQIERAGRICYKSEDKITEDSAKKFVDMLINNGHGAMLEHSTVYLIIKWWQIFKFFRYLLNPYSKIRRFKYITTNFRVLIENGQLDDLQYLCEPTKYHEKRYTLKFITSIGITRELIRHRHFSFANESTRYCNYFKSKFGGEITFINPYWHIKKDNFDAVLEDAENNYLIAIKGGLKPQEAREILPLCTKSEIIMTSFESDWKHFFKLRCDKAAHPDMQIIANKAKEIINNEKV